MTNWLDELCSSDHLTDFDALTTARERFIGAVARGDDEQRIRDLEAEVRRLELLDEVPR